MCLFVYVRERNVCKCVCMCIIATASGSPNAHIDCTQSQRENGACLSESVHVFACAYAYEYVCERVCENVYFKTHPVPLPTAPVFISVAHTASARTTRTMSV